MNVMSQQVKAAVTIAGLIAIWTGVFIYIA